MSILAEFPDPLVYSLALAGFAISLGLIMGFGIFRRRAIIGPDRISPPRTADIHIILIVTAFAGLALSVGFGNQGLQWLIKNNRISPFTSEDEYAAVLQTFAYLADLLIVLATLLVIERGGFRRLGINPGRIGPGMILGLIGLLIVIPWVEGALWITQQILLRWWPDLNPNHPYFQIWPKAGFRFHLVAIVSACVVAPVVEELFFRGLLQTLGLKLLRRESAPSPWQSWMAILISTSIFVSVHPPSHILPLTILAIGLGYLYERTGNLWANISMHAFFNVMEFCFFLHTVR